MRALCNTKIRKYIIVAFDFLRHIGSWSWSCEGHFQDRRIYILKVQIKISFLNIRYNFL